MQKKSRKKKPPDRSQATGRARQRLKLAAIEYANERAKGPVRAKKRQCGRRRFAATSPTLEGRGAQQMRPHMINVSFDVTQEVAAALRTLRDTGLFGKGGDCASVAEELLRRALLDAQILPYWRKEPK